MVQDMREKALRRAGMTVEDVARGIEERAAARKVLLSIGPEAIKVVASSDTESISGLNSIHFAVNAVKDITTRVEF